MAIWNSSSSVLLEPQNNFAVVEADYDNSEILIRYQKGGKDLLKAIKKLLKAIENNENISAKEGEKDIFQVFLERSNYKNQENMNEIINKALENLENANYAGYFEEMDKVKPNIPPHLKTAYAEHKGKFIAGQQPWNFAQQLAVFPKELINSDNSTSSQNNSQAQTIIQKAEKIYNIGNIDTANFD